MSTRTKHSKLANLKSLLVGLAIVTFFYAVRAVTNKLPLIVLPNSIQDFLTLSISVVVESLPFVVLGIGLSILVQVWLPKGFILKQLPKNQVLRRLFISLLGVFLPVCECGNVPLARGFIAKGFTVSESLVFLLAAPILNPVTILTTQQAFGGDLTILVARICGGLLIANIVGWVFSKHKNPETMLKRSFLESCKVPDNHKHSTKRQESLELFVQETRSIMPALLVGAAIAGAVQVVVSRDLLLSLGANVVWSVFAMMLLAFVVSICSNVDAFFALAFKNTFTAGSLVSFLVFGPVIDIKMLSLMRTTYKTKVLVQITVLVALISACLGLVVNYAF